MNLVAISGAQANCTPEAPAFKAWKSGFADTEEERRIELTARALKTACEWPSAVDTALIGIFQSPKDFRLEIDLEAAKNYPELWSKVCLGGAAVISHAKTLEYLDEARAYIYKECGVERTKLATLEEFVASDGPFVLPLMIMSVLDAWRFDFETRRDLARGLAGISAVPAPPTPPSPPPAPAVGTPAK